jgi:5'-methylthioadenosine phosphorylase
MANAGTVQPAIGIIGGSGLYAIAGLERVVEVEVETPFGAPSDAYLAGELEGRRLVFLPRHGRGHRLSPSEVNYRANIHGLKQLGVRHVLSFSAVGSMRPEIKPGDMVIIDQLIDRTRGRASSFFGDGVVGHIQFADPMCAALSQLLGAAARDAGAAVHERGTYICIEGPQFSTRAESRLYRSWGVDVIGMTNVPEAKLAREAGLCYATVAMSTDYDCWHETEEDVSVTAVLEILRKNAELARRIVRTAALRIALDRGCACREATRFAVITDRAAMKPETRARLALILGEGE